MKTMKKVPLHPSDVVKIQSVFPDFPNSFIGRTTASIDMVIYDVILIEYNDNDPSWAYVFNDIMTIVLMDIPLLRMNLIVHEMIHAKCYTTFQSPFIPEGELGIGFMTNLINSNFFSQLTIIRSSLESLSSNHLKGGDHD